MPLSSVFPAGSSAVPQRLKVAVFSHERPNCAVALLRLAGAVRHLEKQGRMDLHWITAREAEFDLETLMGCDLFVIHREFADRRFSERIVRAIRQLGKPIVFELDDLLTHLPESNPNRSYCTSITPDVLQMLREADYVTVTTEPLKRFLAEAEPAAAAKTHVLANYINLDIWKGAMPPAERRPGPFVIGWFGTATHDADLAVIKPAIVHIARKHAGKVLFKFWGYLPKDLEGLPGVMLARGSQPDLRLHARDVVNSHIDLALAPLIDHAFNHAKSDLKWLEYSICYFPGIYSTLSPYTTSITHGQTGWLVENDPQKWIEAMELFIHDDHLRRDIAVRAHDQVLRERSVDVGAEKWDALYRSFVAQGARGPGAPGTPISSRDRAAAEFLFYRAGQHAEKGHANTSLALLGEGLERCGARDSGLSGSLGKLVRHYASAVREVQNSVPLQASLHTGKAFADAGHPEEAVGHYLEAVKLAERSRHPQQVLATLVAVARAFITLDPVRGRQLARLASKLASHLPPAQQKAAAQLHSDYANLLTTRAPHTPELPRWAAANQLHPETSPVASPISIVIPTFNRLELTRQCLAALERDTASRARCEIIVVDNGSSDGTRDFLLDQQSAGRLKAVLNGQNTGFARACNQGAAAAVGEYLLFLNNDTEVTSGWLDPLIRVLDGDANVAAVGSKLLFSDSTLQHAGVAILNDQVHNDPLLAQHVFHRKPYDFPEANRRMTYQALTAACLLVRKGVFTQVGGFDEKYWNGYEDVDLCFKIRAAGRLLVYEPASVVIHHESQSGPERFRNARENIARLHSKWMSQIQPDFLIQTDGTILKQETSAIAPYHPPVADAARKRLTASIVVLVMNQVEHTRKCLDSIAAHMPQPYELIVVDNGSSDGTPEFLKQWQAAHPNCTVICNQSNLGFAAGNNLGLAVARGDYVVLLNNDTVLTSGWFEALLAVFDRHPDTGVVGPVSNNVSGPQQVKDAGYLDLSELPAFAARWREAHRAQSFEIGRAVGFCLLARREVIETIGGLDERFGSGNFEDDDFCIRARLAGFRIRIAQDSFVHHAGGQTFKAARIDYRQAMLRNWELFRTKWKFPAEITLEGGYPIPKTIPAGVDLSIALPRLQFTHEAETDRCWTQRKAQRAVAAPFEIPAVARIGSLDQAREFFGRREFAAAWKAGMAGIEVRPFHPEAWLLLAEVALGAGDGPVARDCARRARDLAPKWKTPKQFLQKPLKRVAALEAASLYGKWQMADGKGAAPRLTVCVIAKNEEQFIGQCLKSIKPVAHQIVVVDTGSSDRTVEIAREHGAEVHTFTWCDDFGAARNAALEHATGDWVLILDADEELPAHQHANLVKDLKNNEAIAFRVPLVNQGNNDGRNYVPRLFRNAPGVFFRGRIHEQVFPSLLPMCRAWGLETRLGTAQLLHHGYSKELVKDRNKIERNLRLLKPAVEEQPDDVNLVMNLGLELVRSGDLEAGLEKYADAFRLMSALAPRDVVPELREALLTQFTCHLCKNRSFDEVVRVLKSPLAANGGLTASLHFALGLAQYDLKQYREAAEQMRQCVAKRDKPALAPINTDILTAAPFHCLALSLVQLGDLEGAENAFQSAMAEKGRTAEAGLDYARFLSNQERPVDALHRLHELVGQDATHAAAWRVGGEIALNRPEFLDFACDWTREAIRCLPEDPSIVAHRAEALLLSQQTATARPLWDKICNGVRPPRALAAVILCAAAESGSVPDTQNTAEELAASRAFVEWYQRLISAGARETIVRLNSRVDVLRQSLPTAARLLDLALAEADQK